MIKMTNNNKVGMRVRSSLTMESQKGHIYLLMRMHRRYGRLLEVNTGRDALPGETFLGNDQKDTWENLTYCKI